MFFGTKKFIGLDIGSSTIKIADLDVGRGGAQLNSFAFLPMPQGAAGGGGDFNNVTIISDAIRALHLQSRSKSKDVCVGMWGTSVIVKRISMPKVEKKLLVQQARWEAEQYIPFDPTEISLAYHVIPSKSPDTMELLLVAAQNAMISQYRNVVSGAGLSLKVLDVSGFALANTFEMNYGKLLGQAVALINVGSSVTNFVVVNDGEVIFSRDIPFGGANYTNEIHKEMAVTFPEAEALKLSAVMGNEVPEQVHSLLNSVNESMVEEIRNSFDFFAASNTGFTVSRCFFTGGSSGVPNLIARASQATNIQFDVLNPFAKVKAGKGMSAPYMQQIAPFASVVMGLALRKAGDS